ncbi:hypothetical protein [Enterococcus sp. AZ012]|uniref:hypothetical protein n=1 Tax=unclassified Enterococcus TaxID=2608891 RepID=UPI003D2D3729
MTVTKDKLNFMEEESISAIVNIWNTGKIPEDSDQIKNLLLTFSKEKYYQLTDQMNLDENDKELFYWLVGSIKLHVVLVSDLDNPAMVEIFAEKSDKDDVVFHDCIDATKDYSVSKLSGTEMKRYLISNNIIKDISSQNLISSTINSSSRNLKSIISRWVKSEYEKVDHFIKPTIESINFDKALIRARKYNLENMFEAINNQQFKAELQECIYSYEHEKWFVCAAGLGGVLEHLLYLILEKNSILDKQFPDNATYNDYIGYMSRKPISIRKREKTMIKNIFNIRNSVSHFNQGFTSKDQCNYLMNGIKDVFNNYYVKDFNISDK